MSEQIKIPDDQDFSGRIYEMQNEASAHREQAAENIRHLAAIAQEVAEAATAPNGVPATALYELQDKSLARRLARNREGQTEVEAAQGWVLVEPTDDVITKTAGKANLNNNSGMGLALTTDGQLHLCVARRNLKPVRDRFEHIDRTDIGRNTFLHKEKRAWYQPSLPKETFLPRYRAEVGKDDALPTLLFAIDDPENRYVRDEDGRISSLVLEQCYDALAEFVQEHRLQPPVDDPITEETTVRLPADEETPTLPLEAAGLDEQSANQTDEAPTEVLAEIDTLSEKERIGRIFDDGLVKVHTWLPGSAATNKLATKHNPTHGGNSYFSVYNDARRATGVDKEVSIRTPETIQKTLRKNGVDEIITISGIGKPFGKVNKNSPKNNEEAVRITYETQATSPRGEVELRTQVILPHSEGVAIAERLTEDPAFIRRVTEQFMADYLELGESWDKTRPNYDKMRAKNGGVSRIGFRTRFGDQPKNTKILEF